MDVKLEWTGERLVTGHLSDTTLEHLHRYALASRFADGNHVLDIASGEGYGSNLLAHTATSVIGVDIAEDAVLHAQQKYRRPNLVFRQGSADHMPVDSNTIDVVISFETIEHHDKHDEMLAEIKRVLKSDGILVLSSPDKRTYSDVPHYKNPYHVKELYLEEFRTLIGAHFTNVQILLQKISYGSLVVPEDASHGFVMYGGDYSRITESRGLPDALYVICIASDGGLPSSYPSFYDGLEMLRSSVESRIAGKDQELRTVQNKLAELQSSRSFRLGRALTWPVRRMRGRK